MGSSLTCCPHFHFFNTMITYQTQQLQRLQYNCNTTPPLLPPLLQIIPASVVPDRENSICLQARNLAMSQPMLLENWRPPSRAWETYMANTTDFLPVFSTGVALRRSLTIQLFLGGLLRRSVAEICCGDSRLNVLGFRELLPIVKFKFNGAS